MLGRLRQLLSRIRRVPRSGIPTRARSGTPPPPQSRWPASGCGNGSGPARAPLHPCRAKLRRSGRSAASKPRLATGALPDFTRRRQPKLPGPAGGAALGPVPFSAQQRAFAACDASGRAHAQEGSPALAPCGRGSVQRARAGGGGGSPTAPLLLPRPGWQGWRGGRAGREAPRVCVWGSSLAGARLRTRVGGGISAIAHRRPPTPPKKDQRRRDPST